MTRQSREAVRERVIELMQRRRASGRALAAAIGVSSSAVSMLMCRRRYLPLKRLDRAAAFLGVSPEYLLGEETTPPPLFVDSEGEPNVAAMLADLREFLLQGFQKLAAAEAAVALKTARGESVLQPPTRPTRRRKSAGGGPKALSVRAGEVRPGPRRGSSPGAS